MKDLILPIGLGILMMSVGLSLTVGDFRRALLYRRAVIIALLCQALLLPMACFLIIKAFELSPDLAIGLMLLSATPGGATANLYSHLAGGDVALNITLTAVNSLSSLVTLPLILSSSLLYFVDKRKFIPLDAYRVMQVLLIVVLPAAVGMLMRYQWPPLSARMEKPSKILATIFLISITASVVYGQWTQVVTHFPAVGAAATLFCLVSLTTGFVIALWANLDKKQAIAISMEVGIHNSGLAIALALSPMILNSPAIAVAPTVYGVLSMFISAAFATAIARTM